MIERCPWLPNYLQYKNEVDQVIEKVLFSGKYILGENDWI